jgi:hypothetical protein
MEAWIIYSVVITAQPEQHFLWWGPDRMLVWSVSSSSYRSPPSMKWTDTQTLVIDEVEHLPAQGCGVREWRDVHIEYPGSC